MVELWPFAERSRGIAFFQLFGRLAGFFTTFVNPIGLANVGWRYLISYCCFLSFEIVFIYFMFPETFGRTLEELAFCKLPTYLVARFKMEKEIVNKWSELTYNCHFSIRGQGTCR